MALACAVHCPSARRVVVGKASHRHVLAGAAAILSHLTGHGLGRNPNEGGLATRTAPERMNYRIVADPAGHHPHDAMGRAGHAEIYSRGDGLTRPLVITCRRSKPLVVLQADDHDLLTMPILIEAEKSTKPRALSQLGSLLIKGLDELLL